MKMLRKYLTLSVVALAAGSLISSCAMEEPFGDSGEGSLTLTTEIRGDVRISSTRSIPADELAALREKCVVYIENSKGVIRKWKGLDNIPQHVQLKVGHYLAEAWSGDSVSASFSSKFYRGKQEFDIEEGENSLMLHCNIANVIASVDPASLSVDLKDLKVTFSHSRGELVFDKDNIETAKGYFMMPNADKNLNYKIEGVTNDGKPYVRFGEIENVQRAHEYRLTVAQDENEVTEGGALIRIVIEDIPVIEDEVEIFPGPAVSMVNGNIDEQVVSLDHNFSDVQLYVRGYFGMNSVTMNLSDNVPDIENGLNLLDGSVISDLASKGIRVERTVSQDASSSVEGGKVNVEEVYVVFTRNFLNSLPESDSEFTFTLNAVDGRRKQGSATLRVANSAAAVEYLAPVGTSPVSDLLAVGVSRARLSGNVYDAASAVRFGIRYRVAGASEWINAYPSSSSEAAARRKARANTRAGVVSRAAVAPFDVIVTGLNPGTTYEYQAFCNGYDNAEVITFTTETAFEIPNSSMEEWGTYVAKTLLGNKTVIFPGTGNTTEVGVRSDHFWDTGNEGGATANLSLTNKSSDMVRSGSYSARLASGSAMGVIAAGNLFTGLYVKTEGTNGVLSLGNTYNGSHPSKLQVWANYRPGGSVKVKSGNESYVEVVKDGTDQAQIYVALTDGAVDVRTSPDNRKLFNKDDEQVVAYGQVTWKEAFGPDGSLKLVEIPLEYKENAKTKRPTHLVIVATASKFGDYFCGSASSVMYLDDFKLVYE
ncbi:MAG: DUF4493 domain-containing protein [Candidatus Amulumruptor caecigallinarius]|nr:DUF4493 domain-containing protein [Candidatus Amulumruptor caecigallinarius]